MTKASLNSLGDSTPNLLLSDPTFVPIQGPLCPSKNNINSIPGTAPAAHFSWDTVPLHNL